MAAASTNGDERYIHELLSKAPQSYDSARATVLYTLDGDVAREANRSFVDWRFDRGSPGMQIAGRPGPPRPQDFYYDYEDRRQWVHLWHQRPDRWREEVRGPDAEIQAAEVYDGREGRRWIYDPPHVAMHVPRIRPRESRDTRLS